MVDNRDIFREAGRIVGRLCQEVGISAERLAEESGVPYATVVEIQRGRPGRPEDFAKVARTLLLHLADSLLVGS
jgi:predicted transcriptional regulator